MKLLFLLLSIIFCCGCIGHTTFKKSPVLQLEISGNVVDLATLKEGGELALTPFKAGPQAEDNDQLDQLSLMLIKGITEVLQAQKTSLTVTDQAARAQLILAGYVEEFTRPGKFSRLVMRKNNSKLSISAQIYLRKTGNKVLTFAVSRNMGALNEDPMSIAYEMGKAMGDYIVDKTTKD